MRIIHDSSELKAGERKVCVAIGVFDGVHLGHQQVIRQTLTDAEQQEALAVVITFDRHPNAVVAPERTPELIYSLPQKLRVIESFGADVTWLIRFDEAFSRQTGEEFVRKMARDFGHIHSICVGSTFTFGHKRSGNVELLRRLGSELHFSVHGLAAVALDGEIVSSTRIRDAIRSGQLEAAGQMLGRGYALSGKVVKGDGFGHTLGFPTANLDTTGLVLPPNGVYAAHAHLYPALLQRSGKDEGHRAAVNIGVRPTLSDPQPKRRVEAHLLDFGGDLYGRELDLTFVEKLRDEQKFGSIDRLKAQIERDIAAARELFGQG
ncbi:MAG: bifunctional riboflavin kinase/FAD synthetase [Verrucomicrobia subdivision 3 bacterium]|nr:bifunctional riboflavin kinase/FAD synthetase [Limisphaerales bacterium]